MRLGASGTVALFGRLYRRSAQPRWALASQLVTSGANLATSMLLVAVLGLEGFGRFSLCFILIMVIRNFLQAVILVPMSTILPRLSPGTWAAYRGFVLVETLVFCLFGAGLLLLFAAPLGLALRAPWLGQMALVMAVASVLGNLADVLRRYHVVALQPARAFGVDLFRFAVQMGLLGAAVLARPGWLDPERALLVLAVGGAAGIAAGLGGLGALRLRTRFLRACWPRHWTYIKWLSVSCGLEAVQANSPFLLGTALLGEAGLGLARAMQQIANVLNIPVNTLQQIAFSMAAAERQAKGLAGLRAFLTRMAGWSGSGLILGSLVLFALAGPILRDGLGLDPAQAMPVLAVFCAYNIVLLARLVLQTWASVEQEFAVITIASAIGAVVSLAAALVVVPLFGSAGVAVAVLLAALTATISYALHLWLRGAWRAP